MKNLITIVLQEVQDVVALELDDNPRQQCLPPQEAQHQQAVFYGTEFTMFHKALLTALVLRHYISTIFPIIT